MKTPDLLSHLHIPRQKPRLQTLKTPPNQKHRQILLKKVGDTCPTTRPKSLPSPDPSCITSPKANNWLLTPI